MGPGRYTQRILLLIVLWAVASSSFKRYLRYAGQVVFGYMMFVEREHIPRYCFLSFWQYLHGLECGRSHCCHSAALIIGLPTLRLHGAFFAIATIAFPLITFLF